ncbi:uncharacterized protein LOC142635544 [Castanea sativa]|uniref:uncharacterized protein LOC142635544 n=1 Tax=Castanea sativa TaxID=21020 RepID=UPI003F64C5C4
MGKGNGPRIFELRKEISSLTQEDLTINAYYTKFKGLWDEFSNYRTCTYGHQVEDCTLSFLMGLNETYAAVRRQILLMDLVPPLRKVFSLLLQDEKQRKVGAGKKALVDEAATLAALGAKPSNAKNYTKSKTGRPQCTHCGVMGHVVDKCYKLHGYPLGLPNGDMVKVTHIGTIQVSTTLTLDHELQHWKMIGLVKRQGGLYTLQCTGSVTLPSFVSEVLSKLSSFLCNKSVNTCNLDSSNNDITSNNVVRLWHYRLGHPSSQRLALLNAIVPKLNSCNNIKSFDCYVYALAKQHKLPFPISTSVSLSCFDLVSIKVLRIDNGPEFALYTFYASKVILHQLSNKSKFDPRAKACIFLGYPFGTKGYKLYDLSTKSVFLSRDVIFKESVFPFKHWLSKPVPFPSSTSHSMFPCQPSIPESIPPVSTEFSLPFSPIDTTVPPDEFPDLVHPDLEPSPLVIDPPPVPSVVAAPLPNMPIVRRSTRSHKPPTYLHDYHCNLASVHVLALTSLMPSHDSSFSDSLGILYLLSSTLSYAKLSTTHRAFSVALTVAKEPTSYAQALTDPLWQAAIKAEIDAFQANHT